ncbi:FitA-like ribbon-helix-helix domain-containing protein [Pararobbsia silviterrae]|uniref:DNA-binding protein n=1 Tax=Pararobbsia silviterrae TaxID=1792498 RepID=A0A494XND6_9BURK|nr:DNA-binding protein [Pararobbsia silviterrae]RKP49594.1 DNA-binding protein [Pararobbsia silviterrae]
MATLIVRNVDEHVVQALRELAASHGRSAESEHREILSSALLQPRRKTFVEALMDIPDVGEDSDFERIPSDEAPRVFD